MSVHVSVEMAEMFCGECGISFFMPERLREDRRENGGNWYCPNGHVRGYVQTEADKLRKDVDRLTGQRNSATNEKISVRDTLRAMLDRSDRRIAALKGQITKLKRKGKRG